MPRGRTTTLTVHLTPAERATLHAWQRSSTLPVGLARRGRIILLLAEGRPILQIARVVGIARHRVYKWIARFQGEGLAGLHDRPRPGRTHQQGEESLCRGG